MSKINQETKDKFIAYYIEQKKLKKMKKEIATEQTLFSYTTANRVMKDVDSWTKQEMEEFEIRQENRLLLSSKAKEEPVSEVMNQAVEEQFEEELKDGDIVEHEGKKYKFIHSDKTHGICKECDLSLVKTGFELECICAINAIAEKSEGYFVEVAEETEILDEIAAKNEELQKELHTQKVVIETLQNGVNELNETITESKCMIAEVAKERDDKDEEIRLLNLELQKYKNDLNSVLDDRQKLECLLPDNANAVELNPKYDSLYKVLLMAYNQASNGKGKERHQLNDDEAFENQKICEIARRLSVDYNLGQAVKKIYESKRLTDERDIAELYGAINYIAAAIIVKQEEK